MNWLNLEIRTLRSPAYIGSDPAERATWIGLLAFCCEQENGGRIDGAKLWKDRQWQQLCAVTQREVMRATKLLVWDGDDLIVTGYPLDKEAEVRQMRSLGASKTDKKALAARENGALGGRPITQRETQREETQTNPTETHRKEVEWKGKETEKEPPTLPKPSASRGVVEGKESSMIPTTEQSTRFAKILHRNLGTRWSKKEVEAYKLLGVIPEDDLSAVERYYSANWPPKSGVNILRHDMLTFLNNFPGEVDRAKAMKEKAKVSKKGEWLDSTTKIVALPDPAEDERLRCEAKRHAENFRKGLG